VLFDLVSDSTDLSKHHINYSLQSFKEILAAKELLPLVSELDKNAMALWNQGAAMQVVKLDQISQVLIPTLFLISMLLSPCYNLIPADQQAIA
jgi:hypothetical protein